MTAPAPYLFNACGIKGAVACPPRWSRVGGNNCPNCASNYGNLACITNPGRFYTTYELDQRRKVEILKYKKNSAQLSKAQQYSMASRNALTRKKSWATQTQTYTNPNVDNLPEIQNEGVTVALKCNQPIVPCSLTSDCDVPGPVIPLCIDESVPLYNYKMQLSYPSGGKEGITELPIVCGYEGEPVPFVPTPPPPHIAIYSQPLPGMLTAGVTFDSGGGVPIPYTPGFTLTSVTFYSPPTFATTNVVVLFFVSDGNDYVYTVGITIPANTSDQTITAPLNLTLPAASYLFGFDASGLPSRQINYYNIVSGNNWCGSVNGYYN